MAEIESQVCYCASMSIDTHKTALAEFLANNPASSVAEFGEPHPCIGVKTPWGDESIALDLTDGELTGVLNGLILPERYTAIWHTKTKRFEVIFTAYELNPIYSTLPDRSFHFLHHNKDYTCTFGVSSDELLSISSKFFAAGPITASIHRNLDSFRGYYARKEKGQPLGTAQPISFWIDGIDWHEDLVLDLVNHLNFYMSYFDAASPMIAVHSPIAENIARQPQARYLFEVFPSSIKARAIDDNLLKYWEAARSGDPAGRFLYCYQIIEYCSIWYVEDNIRKSIKKTLLNPMGVDAADISVQRVIECVSETKLHDSQKVDNMIREIVDPSLIWREIENNIDFFSRKLAFDGGFSLDPIVKQGWKFDDFEVNGLMAVSGALRRIRNALSHGKDQKTMLVIAPTKSTFEKLQSWVPIASITAGEAIVYGVPT